MDYSGKLDEIFTGRSDASDMGMTFLVLFPQLVLGIEGFETPYGLELLSSVHWLATHAEPPAMDAQDAVTGMARWNERKRTMFRQEHIPIAWNRLASENWIAA